MTPAAMASDLARDERAMLNGGVLPTDVMHEILLRVPAKRSAASGFDCWMSFVFRFCS
jgi:hypothetical protein